MEQVVVERREASSPVGCATPLVLLVRDSSEFVGLLPCRTWACDACSVFLRRRLFARASAAFASIPDGASVSFLTFTMRRFGWASLNTAASVMLNAWRRWLQYVRKSGWSGRFLRVVETHKSGVPHFHVLADKRLPSDFLSKLWNACLRLAWRAIVGAPTFNAKLLKVEWLGTIDAKRASGRKCLSYALKYVAKGEDRRRLLSAGVRRVWSASVGFLPPIFKVEVQKGRFFVMTFRRYDEFVSGQAKCDCGRVSVRTEGCLDSTRRNVSDSDDHPTANGEKPTLFPTKPLVVDFPDGSSGLPGPQKARRRRRKPNNDDGRQGQ